MPDPGMMLRDLDGFRGSSRRPWLVIVTVVILATLAGILLVRHLERGQTVAPEPETPPAAPSAAAATSDPTATPPAADAMPAEVAGLLARAQADEAADQLLAVPALDAVGVAHLEQLGVEVLDDPVDPGLGAAGLGRSAFQHHA